MKALWLFLFLLKLLFLLRRFIKLTFKKEIGRNYSRTVLLCPLRLLTTAVIETLEGILRCPPLFLAILCTHKIPLGPISLHCWYFELLPDQILHTEKDNWRGWYCWKAKNHIHRNCQRLPRSTIWHLTYIPAFWADKCDNFFSVQKPN